jgi:phosphatidylserine/phosphatidylglycerophosphate/cardiolipin synthase-like enzyme
MILITELFYRGSDDHEFLCLYNPADTSVDLSEWRIADGEYSYSGTLIFPNGATFAPKSEMYIAHNASAFYDIMGFYPEYEYGNSTVSVSQMIRREEPGFSNERDEVMFTDSYGKIIDMVVYGDSEYEGFGWIENPVPDAKRGERLKRNFNELNNSYEDTDSSSDWKHMRHYKLGQSNFTFESITYQGNLTLFASPDSSYEILTSEIGKAKSSIYIGLYQFTNWNISQKILDKLSQGVEIKILMEGGPVEGILVEEKYILSKIYENGGDVRFLVSNSTLSGRYRYLHGKYAIIDNTSVIISSENWKYTGIPINNTYGNRGWGVVIENEDVAEYFLNVFFADWDYVDYDIFHFTPEDPKYGNSSSGFEPDDFIETGYYDPVFPGKTVKGEFTICPVLSPDTSLSEEVSILGLIDSATESIYIEQLDISVNWNEEENQYENLYLTAAIKAAEERNVNVRILLSSKYAFPDDPNLDNYDTFVYINNYAENHNISDYLEARLADYDRLGLAKIHNKGIIVDGSKTLVSSINWNRNSVTQNREVGVIIENAEVAEYFTRMFFWDWNEPPVAEFEGDINVNSSQAVSFNDISYDSDSNIINYYWDFGDGTNSTEQNPTHTFMEEGIYIVRLMVSDGQYSDSITKTIYVGEPETTGQETDMAIMTALLLIFVIIIIIIIAFIRRMRLQFI